MALVHICPVHHESAIWALSESENSSSFTTNPNEYASMVRNIFAGLSIVYHWKDFTGYSTVSPLTNVGYCESFNLLNPSDIFNEDILSPAFFDDIRIASSSRLNFEQKFWSIESGYDNDESHNTFPFRSTNVHAHLGFMAGIFSRRKDLFTSCEYATSGFKVIFHNPYDWPVLSNNYVQLSNKEKYNMIITPSITKTSDSLISYEPEQ